MKPREIKTIDWYHYNALFFLEHWLGYPRFKKHFGERQKKLYDKIDGYLTGTNRGIISEVESVSKDLTYEQFMEQCYKPGLPKIFRGAASDWNAVKNWNFDFFEKEHGHKEILLNDNVGLANQQFEKMDLKYYINQIRNGSLKYLRFSDVVNDDENLKNDFDLNWLRRFNLPLSWGEDLKMFMGGSGTVTPFHVGFSGFLFVQVMGQKKWTLYPPGDRIFLDPRTERTFYYYSKANPYERNSSDFPILKHSRHYEVVLNPGDVLWVPSFTWHYVENPTDSIGIRYGRSCIPAAAKSSRVLTALMFMATRPTMLEHFYTSRRKKRQLLFIKSQAELEKEAII